MNFWAQRLGQAQPQQDPAPPQPAPSNRPWWQPQSVAPVVQQPPPVTGVVPSADPSQLPQPTAQPVSVAPDGEAHFGDLLQQSGYTTEKAQSAKSSEPCPSCGSNKYMGIAGQPNKMPRCFECGYNPRFTQSMAGLSGTGQNIPVKTARVQQMNTSTYNPQHIVGKV